MGRHDSFDKKHESTDEGEASVVKEVTCPCGWRARGTEKEIIALVVEHGRTAHSQDLTADDVRPIWYDVSETSA